MLLTAKQEKFAQCLYSGMSQLDAWGAAGYSTNYPDINIASNASTLANSTKIQRRLNELRKPVIDILQADELERRRKLAEITRKQLPKRVKVGNIISAIQELNRMDHVYEEKRDVTSVTTNFVFVLPDGSRVKPKELVDGNRDEGDSPTTGASEHTD